MAGPEGGSKINHNVMRCGGRLLRSGGGGRSFSDYGTVYLAAFLLLFSLVLPAQSLALGTGADRVAPAGAERPDCDDREYPLFPGGTLPECPGVQAADQAGEEEFLSLDGAQRQERMVLEFGGLLYHAGLDKLPAGDAWQALRANRSGSHLAYPDFPVHLWEDLSRKYQDNPAVLFCLFRNAVEAWAWAHTSQYRQNYEAILYGAAVRLDELLSRFNENEDARAEYAVLEAEGLARRWYVVRQMEQAPRQLRYLRPEDWLERPAYADDLLEAAAGAYLRAGQLIAPASAYGLEFRARLAGFISSMSGSALTPVLVRHLQKMSALLDTFDLTIPDDFPSLDQLARTRMQAAAWLEGEEARNGIQRALELYRSIAAIRERPTREVHGLIDYPQIYSLESYAAACLRMAALEEDSQRKQEYVEESLQAMHTLQDLYPEYNDASGHYGWAWHYLSMAEVTPFPEKRKEYIDLADERLRENIRTLGDPEEIWGNILEMLPFQEEASGQ